MTQAMLKPTPVTSPEVVSVDTTKNLHCRESTHKTPLRLATQRLATSDRSGIPCLSEFRCQPRDARQMCVSGLNHFNISASADLIEKVKRFYVDVIGLALGPRAHLDHEGYWLYAGCTPIVHLSIRGGSRNQCSKGSF